jgi:hypothetical protein
MLFLSSFLPTIKGDIITTKSRSLIWTELQMKKNVKKTKRQNLKKKREKKQGDRIQSDCSYKRLQQTRKLAEGIDVNKTDFNSNIND